MCDRVGVLYAGRLVEEGPVDDVFHDPRHPYAVGLLRCLPRGGVRKDQQRLDTIPGFLPQLGADLPACVFVERCGLAQDVCSQEEPPFHDLGNGRHSRCHFWEKAHELPRATPESAAFKPVDQSAEPVIRAESLSKTFRQEGRDIRAVDDLNFVLRPGETLGLVGESGSGKTTLARTLLGLIAADEGRSSSSTGAPLAKQITKRGRDDVRALQIVFQNPDSALNRRFSVQRILGRALTKLRGDAGRRARGAPARARPLGPLRHAADPLAPGAAVGRSEAARRDRARVRRRAARRRLRRADVGARRLGAGGDPQPAGRAAGREGRHLPVHLARPRGRALPVGPHRRALPRAADGARRRRDRVRRPAPSLHGGAAVVDPAGRRRGPRADPAPRRDPEPRETRRRVASSTPAARATSATSAIRRSRSSRRSSPGTSGAATTRSRSCASCSRRRPSSGPRSPTAASSRSRTQGRRPSRRRRASAEGPSRRPGRGRSAAGGDGAGAGAARARARRSCGSTRAASATRTSTRSTARLRRAAPPCSATRARASSSRSARACALAPGTPVVLSWLPACGRCERVRCATSPPLRDRVGRACTTAGCSTAAAAVALRRADLPLLLPLLVRRARGRAGGAAAPDPGGVPFDIAALVGCAVTTGTGAVWRTAAVRPGERVCVFGCGGVGMSAVLGAVGGRRRPDRRRRPDATTKLDGGAVARRDARASRWAGGAEATAERVREAVGRRRRLRVRGDRADRGGARRVPRDPRARRRGADRDPRGRRRARAAGAADPAARAARARLGLRLVAARARLPGAARALPRAGGCRSTGCRAPAAARRGGGGVRRPARRRGAARCAGPGGEHEWTSLDGPIGEAWAGEAPDGSHINVVLAERGSATAAAAVGALAEPAPRPHAVPRLPRARATSCGRRRSSSTSPRSTARRSAAHVGRGAARRRPGRARPRRRGAVDPAERGRRRARGVWIDPAAGDETALKAAHARRCGRRSPTRYRPGGASRALVGAPRGGDQRLTTAVTDLRSRRRGPPLRASSSSRRSPPPGTRCRAAGRGDVVDRPLRGRHWRATRAAASCPTPRCSSACWSASTRGARRSCASSARPSTCTAGGRGAPRSRPGTSSAAALGEPLWRLLGGRSERLLAYASSGELVAPDERARRVAALRDAGVRAVKLRFHHADWREDVAVVERVRDAVGSDVELMVDANQGWRMPGDRGARWDVATATHARGRSSRSASTGWRSRCATDDVEGYARATGGDLAADRAGEMVRGLHEARDLVLRGGVDVDPARRRARGRHRRRPADRRARGAVRPDVVAAHVVQRARAAGQPPPRPRRLHVPVPRGPARPAGVDARTARLAARRPVVAIAPDGTVGPPRRARLGVVPTSTRWRRTASP